MAQEGVEQPKPLVPVCGEPMIERLLRIFVDCGATEIVVIVNEWSTAVREHLEQMKLPVPLRLVVKTTPSSMHSLHALSHISVASASALPPWIPSSVRRNSRSISATSRRQRILTAVWLSPHTWMMKNRCG